MVLSRLFPRFSELQAGLVPRLLLRKPAVVDPARLSRSQDTPSPIRKRRAAPRRPYRRHLVPVPDSTVYRRCPRGIPDRGPVFRLPLVLVRHRLGLPLRPRYRISPAGHGLPYRGRGDAFAPMAPDAGRHEPGRGRYQSTLSRRLPSAGPSKLGRHGVGTPGSLEANPHPGGHLARGWIPGDDRSAVRYQWLHDRREFLVLVFIVSYRRRRDAELRLDRKYLA